MLQGKAIVARGSCGSKEQFNESRSARFASANAGETGVGVRERFLAARGLGLTLRVGDASFNAKVRASDDPATFGAQDLVISALKAKYQFRFPTMSYNGQRSTW